MKKVSLSGSLREGVGKKDAKSLRNQGLVPAVLYGGDQQFHFSVPRLQLEKLIFTPDVFQIELTVGDKTFITILKDIQFHPVSDAVVHADFLELFTDKAVKVGLPLRIEGNAIGVINGGKLNIQFRKLDVLGLPGELPEDIVVNIEKLRIGQSIRVGEIEVPNCTILNDPKAVAVMVKAARGAAVGSDDEGEEEEATEEAENAES